MAPDLLRFIVARNFPVIAGLVKIILGSFGLYLCLPVLMNVVNYLPSLGFITFGIVASYLSVVGGVSSLLKRYYLLSLLSSYLMFVWYAAIWLSPLIFNTAMFGSPYGPNVFPTTPLEFLLYMTFCSALLLLPSFLCSVLIDKSKTEFLQKSS